MTISDATPIQFWLNGEQTFNQANPICGLTNACFCQPFNCGDDIKIQFTDTVERSYVLKIFDSESNELSELEFDVTEEGGEFVYFLEFTFDDEDICGQMVNLQISYYEFANGISGGLTDLLEDITGDIEFVGDVYSISGGLTDLLEEVSASIEITTQVNVTNSSTDISVTDVQVNNVSVTVDIGSFPIGPSQSANLRTKETGVYTIDVYFTISTGSQLIQLIDSDGNIFCQDAVLSPASFIGCVISPGLPISIGPANGTC